MGQGRVGLRHSRDSMSTFPQRRFICHVRLKRSGAWWYEVNSNQMLALRCAKYNGTFHQIFTRHQRQKSAA
jgi:hypothetical protein